MHEHALEASNPNACHVILLTKKHNIKAIRFTKSVSAIIYSLYCKVLLTLPVVHENGGNKTKHPIFTVRSFSALIYVPTYQTHSSRTKTSNVTLYANANSLNLKLDFLAFCTLAIYSLLLCVEFSLGSSRCVHSSCIDKDIPFPHSHSTYL